MLEKPIKEAYFTDVSIPNSRNLCSTITKKLQKYTNLKEELIKIWQLNADCIVPIYCYP
jgi:hypothetical protein